MNEASAAKAWTRREYGLALLAICLFWVAAAIRWPLNELVVPWDSKTQFYAFFRFLGKAAELGSTPYWNPFHYGGHPSIADPQSLVFNPLFRLLSLLDPRASMEIFDGMVQLHLLIGGLSALHLARNWGLRPSGAVLAALILMLGGSASSRLQHAGEIMSYATFPLALLLLDLALKRGSYLLAAAFGLTAGFMALGRDQVAYLACIALLIYAALWLVAARPFWTRLLRALPILITCGIFGLATIIVPILLTLQFAELSNRPEIGFDIAAMGSLYPPNLATLFAANFFGTYDLPFGYFVPSYDTRPLIDGTDRATNYLFAGTLTPFLVFLIPRTSGRALNYCLGLFIVMLIYALGTTTPLFRLVYDYVPGVDLYRRPADATFLLNIALALLAGAALSRFETSGVKRPSWGRIALGGALFIIPVLSGLHFASMQGKLWRSLLELLVPVLSFLVAGAVLLAAKRAQTRLLLSFAIILVTGIELNFQNTITSLNSEPRAPYEDLEAPKGEAAKALSALDAALKTDIEQKELRSRTEVLGLGGPWQNLAMVQGIESTNGYNPLRIGAFDTLVRPGQNSHVLGYRKFTPSTPSLDSALARRIGLGYILTAAPRAEIPRWYIKELDRIEPVYVGSEVFVYRLPNILPRAALASRIKRIERPESFEPESYKGLDREDQVHIFEDTILTSTYGAEAIEKAAASIISERPDMIEIEFSTDRPAILTLNNTYYPGWVVEIDGKLRPVIETNLLFQGVEVLPGEHKARFQYRPLSIENLLQIARGLVP